MTMTTHRWFPPLSDYVIAQHCATCTAAPWTDCAAPRKARRHHRTDRQHSRRQLAGMAHYNSDVSQAPWLEDRVPGRSYGTITTRPAGTPMNEEEPHDACPLPGPDGQPCGRAVAALLPAAGLCAPHLAEVVAAVEVLGGPDALE